MRLYLLMATRNLRQARRRTLLLSMALGFVSMFMMLLMTLSQGLGDTLVRSATLLITGHVNVAGYYKTRPNNAATVLTPVDAVRKQVAQSLPDATRVVDRLRGWAKLTSPQGSLEATLSGIDLADESALLDFLQLAHEYEYAADGSNAQFGDVQGLLQPHSAVLFAAQARRLGVRVGDMLTLSAETLGGVQNTDEVEVAAIVRDAGYLSNRIVLVNKTTLRGLFRLNPEATGIVMIYLDRIEAAVNAVTTLRHDLTATNFVVMGYSTDTWRQKIEAFKNEDWTGQRIDLTTWENELGNMVWVLKTLNTLTALFIAILTLIVVAGIINTMWIAVRERTQEVGMLRAIGMSRPRVLLMFLCEGLVLSLGATTMGSLGGAAVAWGLNVSHMHVPVEAMQTVLMTDVLRLSVRPVQVIQTVTLFTLCTGLASLWPALRATRLQPLTAIQKVG